MTEERAEKNRLLAEWLEPMPDGPDTLQIMAAIRSELYSPLKAWECDGHGDPIVWAWHPRDFYLSEEASAMVLEKMLMPLVKKVSTGRRIAPHMAWECWPNPTASGNYDHVRNVDRKTAICEAALALIESAKEKG